MDQYLYGEKEGVHIFDLTKTKVLLTEALNILREASKSGKVILFVGTKKQVKVKLREVATAANCFYVNERWLGGCLTNFDQMKRSTRKLTDLKKAMAAGEFKDRTKKERLLIQREIERLERFFSGVVGMDKIPDLMVIIDIKRERTAVAEANNLNVETIAIVDSNCDPTMVTYPIPMNDDASKALEYVLDLMKEAILGKASVVSKSKIEKKVQKVKSK